MKLCNTTIRRALRNGSLRIRPAPRDEDINVTTVDCKLGQFLYVLKQGRSYFFDDEEESIQAFWERNGRKIDLRRHELDGGKKGYWLRPGEVCLAMTREHITLPLTGKQVLQGTIWGRSRTARSFIRVHVDAPEIKPGTDNCVTLEIKNEGPITVRLYFGKPIAQISFEEVKGAPGEFHSDFHGQTHASGRKAPRAPELTPRQPRTRTRRDRG